MAALDRVMRRRSETPAEPSPAGENVPRETLPHSGALTSAPEPKKWTHRWVTRKQHGERYQALCRLIPRNFRNGWYSSYGFGSVVTVEFEDGTQVQASRIYVRRLGVAKGGGWQEGKYGDRRRKTPVP